MTRKARKAAVTKADIAEGRMSSEAVAERLLEEATSLFASKGFDATSVQDIVDAAGVTKGALYYYFASKNEVLFAIHQRFIVAGLININAVVAQKLTPADRLFGLVVALVESIALYLDGVTVFFREQHRLSPVEMRSARVNRDAFVDIFKTTIAEGQAAGYFRSDIPVDIATLGVFGAANWTYTWFRPGGRLSAGEIGRHIAKLVLAGLIGSADDSRAPGSTRGAVTRRK